MDIRSRLIALSDRYAAFSDLPLSVVSSRACGDCRVLGSVKAGRDLTTRRAEAILAWFSQHWPASEPWPVGIDRHEVASPDFAPPAVQ